MTGVKAGDASNTKEAILSKFAPVLALKSSAPQPISNSRTLKLQEQQQAWTVSTDVLPTILAQCSGLSTHPKSGDGPFSELLWDFLNGREICISLNKFGGFDLSINAERVHWMETQLPLDMLFFEVIGAGLHT
ncbi:hypothetical protein K3X13_10505 [Aliiroseovarius crassostreae]|uniref:hypothetical protein n=1 Tax=Aliiroseovarius crassostreae TaxID=154981 RepID=UPI0021FF12BB|nr:hypothetical protein [Aliiroseovarius crassostreae]UWP91491.1 hypothetical protein K3X13_10505 [Aliiroseovarius crassostreae]